MNVQFAGTSLHPVATIIGGVTLSEVIKVFNAF
jgi:hypothetical protein